MPGRAVPRRPGAAGRGSGAGRRHDAGGQHAGGTRSRVPARDVAARGHGGQRRRMHRRLAVVRRRRRPRPRLRVLALPVLLVREPAGRDPPRRPHARPAARHVLDRFVLGHVVPQPAVVEQSQLLVQPASAAARCMATATAAPAAARRASAATLAARDAAAAPRSAPGFGSARLRAAARRFASPASGVTAIGWPAAGFRAASGRLASARPAVQPTSSGQPFALNRHAAAFVRAARTHLRPLRATPRATTTCPTPTRSP